VDAQGNGIDVDGMIEMSGFFPGGKAGGM